MEEVEGSKYCLQSTFGESGPGNLCEAGLKVRSFFR